MCVYLTFQTIAKFAIFLFYLVLEKRYTYQPTKHKIQSSLSNYLHVPTAIPIHLPQHNQPTPFLFVEILSIVRCSRICRCLVFFCCFRLLPLLPLLPLLLSTYNATTTTTTTILI